MNRREFIETFEQALSVYESKVRARDDKREGKKTKQEEISQLLAGGGSDDPKTVRKLSDAQSALQLFDSDIMRLDSEIPAALEALKPLLVEGAAEITREFGRQRDQHIHRVREFLLPLIEPAWRVDELVAAILPHVAIVNKAESAANQYSPTALSTLERGSGIVWKSRSVLDLLKRFEASAEQPPAGCC